jgi:hypothetical protein
LPGADVVSKRGDALLRESRDAGLSDKERRVLASASTRRSTAPGLFDLLL